MLDEEVRAGGAGDEVAAGLEVWVIGELAAGDGAVEAPVPIWLPPPPAGDGPPGRVAALGCGRRAGVWESDVGADAVGCVVADEPAG